MYYHLTLHRPSGISLCVPGCFCGEQPHSEFVLLRGARFLELWILHPNLKLTNISKQELYGEIISMKPFKPAGADRDFLIASTRDGEALIFIYDFRHRAFIRVYTCWFPPERPSQRLGHFVAADPRGRAFIMGAKENTKAVLSVNMFDQYNIDVSSIPFENDGKEHKKGVTYDIVFLYDVVDKDIVSFASTETVIKNTMPDLDKVRICDHNTEITLEQSINFFDIDLKRRKVELKRTEVLKHRSNFLMEVPGGSMSPGGVLIFSLNSVVYKGGKHSARCPIPRRFTESRKSLQRPIMFINCTMYQNREMFYYLAQTELGDIFKITLATGNPIELQMQFFCNLRLASHLCILEPYYLFVAHESGNHCLYDIAGLPLSDEPVFSSILGFKDNETFFFWPNLQIVLRTLQEIPSLSPMLSMPLVKPCSLYVFCASDGNFDLRGIHQRIQICSETEIMADNYLQQKVVATAVKDLNVLWSRVHAIQLRGQDLIILSYDEKSVVFALVYRDTSTPSYGTPVDEGGRYIAKVDVPDIYKSANTLAIRVLYDVIIIQITAQGIHTNCPDNYWRVPTGKRVETCALNNVQALLVLNDTTLHYANIGQNGQLIMNPEIIEIKDKTRCVLLSDDIGQADYALIGTPKHSLFVISLRPGTLFQCVYRIPNLLHPVTSLLSCHIGHQVPGKLKLFIGLFNGDLLVTHMDHSTGRIENNIKKYNLGTDPIKMFDCGEMVMVLTNYTWLYLIDNGKVVLKRFYAGKVDTGCNFRETNKFFTFTRPLLRLVHALNLNAEVRFGSSLTIQYLPMNVVAKPCTSFIFYTQPLEKESTEEPNQADMYIPTPQGRVESSLLHVYNTELPHEHFILELKDAISCSIAFNNNLQDPIMIIGSQKASDPSRGVLKMLKTYVGGDGKLQIHLLDRVELEGVPTAMEAFGAGIAVGVGKEIRIFYCNSEMKLCEDCKCLCASTSIDSISTQGYNILVKDSEEGIVILKYNINTNKIEVFARDRKPVWLCCFFGQNSIAITDICGNITIVKYPGLKEFGHSNEEELLEKLWFANRGPKGATVTNFNVGEVVHTMQVATFYMEGQQVLLYSTLSGAIGIITQLQKPAVSPPAYRHLLESVDIEMEKSLNQIRRESEFLLIKLEKFMLARDPVYCKDHITFRAPHKSLEKIVNGDLCEEYINLDSDTQDQFSRYIGLTPEEIVFRLIEIRNLSIW